MDKITHENPAYRPLSKITIKKLNIMFSSILKSKKKKASTPFIMSETGIKLNKGQTDLQSFESPIFGKLRAMLIFNQPWYVGNDVARALDYSAQERPTSWCVCTMDKHLLLTPEAKKIRPKGIVAVNKYGLQSMARLSGSPIADDFVKWATSDIVRLLKV